MPRPPISSPSFALIPKPVSQPRLGALGLGAVLVRSKDINVGFANINAKAEGVENRPPFREAFQRRRCLVPVENFYEWKKTATGKQPHAIAPSDRGLMALAGLWENWRSSAGEWGAQLRDRHDDSERAVRRAAQPNLPTSASSG